MIKYFDLPDKDLETDSVMSFLTLCLKLVRIANIKYFTCNQEN